MSGEPWFDTMIKAMKTVDFKEDGQTSVQAYCKAMEAWPAVYEILFSIGMVVSNLKGDITNSLKNVMQSCSDSKLSMDTCTFADMLAGELNRHGQNPVNCKGKATGNMGLLWSTRAVTMTTTLIRNLLEKPEMTSSAAATDAYEKVLKPYHGWITSKLVGTAFSACPYKEDIFKKLQLKEGDPETKAKIMEFLNLMEPFCADIMKLLEKNGMNYQDVV